MTPTRSLDVVAQGDGGDDRPLVHKGLSWSRRREAAS
jgi:hypothetical protein